MSPTAYVIGSNLESDAIDGTLKVRDWNTEVVDQQCCVTSIRWSS
jgi:hypothetical protein